MSTFDAATIEIVRSHLKSAAEEMRITLERTAFSPVIYEVRDFGISIYDRNLELMAVAPGLATFIAANDQSAPLAIAQAGRDGLRPGDIVLMNYPYWNAGHTSDATLVAPVFLGEDTPSAYLCVRVHWADLGAKDPGYVVDSTDMYQEGIVFPGTKIYRAGRPDEQIIDLIRFNSRMPETVLGDLDAQVAAIRTGERRITEIYEKFGAATVERAVAELTRIAEERTRTALRALPQGTWTASTQLDNDGITDEPLAVRVTVTNADGHLTIDFAGSADAARGPVNMPFGKTVAVCKLALRALTSPHEPANAGHTRPVTVKAEPGTLFHAVHPAPTFTLWAAAVALELIFACLSQGMPESVQAPSGGDGLGFMTVGRHPVTGALVALSCSEPCGWGATAEHDGADALEHIARAIMRNTPIEVLETRSGLMIEKLEIRADSGGAGRFRGGMGVERHVRAVAPGQLLSLTKTAHATWPGVAGGAAGAPNTNVVFAGSEREKRTGTYRIEVEPGDRLIVLSAGGGGYGDPRERPRDAVRDDVLDGYVSPAAAAALYGQVFNLDEMGEPVR